MMPSPIRFSSIYMQVPGTVRMPSAPVRSVPHASSPTAKPQAALELTLLLDVLDRHLLPAKVFDTYGSSQSVQRPSWAGGRVDADRYDLTVLSDGQILVNTTNSHYQGAPLAEKDRVIRAADWQALATELLKRAHEIATNRAHDRYSTVAFFKPSGRNKIAENVELEYGEPAAIEALPQAFALKTAVDALANRQNTPAEA